MDNRLIFLYLSTIVMNWGGTGFDKSSALLIWRLKGKSVSIGKSVEMTASLDENVTFW